MEAQPKAARVDKHSRKRTKDAKLKARTEERARRHEAKVTKMYQRAEATVRLLSRVPTHISISCSVRPAQLFLGCTKMTRFGSCRMRQSQWQ